MNQITDQPKPENTACKFLTDSTQAGQKGKFNVYRRRDYPCKHKSYNRRDFYKITLIEGEGKLQYADRGVIIHEPAIFFAHPLMQYSWEPTQEKQSGYFCVFSEDFIQSSSRSKVMNDSPLFRMKTDPLIVPSPESAGTISGWFEKMIAEWQTDYPFKFDLIRSYLDLIVHETAKLRPVNTDLKFSNASSRIANMFFDLLEHQFPIHSSATTLSIKTPHDFAEKLSIHVNHLNRAVKEITGRTTTEHIADRIVQEAGALLHHTNLNISEIAYSLGFEYPAHFNNFIKKQTGRTPGELRIT